MIIELDFKAEALQYWQSLKVWEYPCVKSIDPTLKKVKSMSFVCFKSLNEMNLLYTFILVM